MKRLAPTLCLLAAPFFTSSVHAQAAIGATTPFVSFEAENGVPGGGATVRTMNGPVLHERSTPEMESSGRAFVELKGLGQSVSWMNKTRQSFTAINLRFCIPDAPKGGGTTSSLALYVDGKFRQSIPLSSAQSWLYHNNGTKDPSAGDPFKFYDETHCFIAGAPVAPGSTLMLRQDAANNAAFYWIDVIDLETPPPPSTQPPDSLSITDYGARADDKTFDSTAAIQRCFDDARAKKKTAWIPRGTFYLTTAKGLYARDITILGAGMWHSLIYRQMPLPSATKYIACLIEPTSCTIKDLAFDQNAPARDGPWGDGGGINMKGDHWLVDSVWVQHTSSGLWADGTNGLVKNCRMLSTWGDGINLNNGNSGNVGENLTAINNFVRGNGDDGLAINSDATSHLMKHITVMNNTSVAIWWANNLGVYGGADVVVKNNLLMDACTEYGLSVGVFGNGGSPLVSGVIENNLILRAGDKRHAALNIGTNNETNSIANVHVAGNTIVDPITEGVTLRKGVNVVVENNRVDGGGKPGFVIASNAAGSGVLLGNLAKNISTGDPESLAGTKAYTVIKPIDAAGYKTKFGNIVTGPCSEGGRAIAIPNNGDYTAYPNTDLKTSATFIARVASPGPGGTISIYLDNPQTLAGTCTVPSTGGPQNWVNVYCALTGATGTHNVYLRYNGTGPGLFNLTWFAFSPSALTSRDEEPSAAKTNP
ncbi:MAG TPA: carbohydrate-binding protein [Rariglobus sp.]|jgi:hypothetical protein|nr:carbohydrate-binding protein [Rariglobus sp.]